MKVLNQVIIAGLAIAMTSCGVEKSPVTTTVGEEVNSTDALSFGGIAAKLINRTILDDGKLSKKSAEAIEELGGELINKNGYHFVKLTEGKDSPVFPRCEGGQENFVTGASRAPSDTVWTKIRYGWQKPNYEKAQAFQEFHQGGINADSAWREIIKGRDAGPWEEQACVYYFVSEDELLDPQNLSVGTIVLVKSLDVLAKVSQQPDSNATPDTLISLTLIENNLAISHPLKGLQLSDETAPAATKGVDIRIGATFFVESLNMHAKVSDQVLPANILPHTMIILELPTTGAQLPIITSYDDLKKRKSSAYGSWADKFGQQ